MTFFSLCSIFHKPHYSNVPDLENFPGPVIHSRDYRIPDEFVGHRVLVIGARFSGSDIAIEVANAAEKVYLSHRKTKVSCSLPDNIIQVPQVQAISVNGMVSFDNGETSMVDSIIVCTGFELSLPFLTPESGLTIQGNNVYPLHKHMVNVEHPSMAIIGLPIDVMPFPLRYYQVEYLLSVWGGMTKLPGLETMRTELDRDWHSRQIDDTQPKRYFGHHLGKRQWDYYNDLARNIDISPPPPVWQALYIECFRQRDLSLMTFRKLNYRIQDNQEFRIEFDQSKQ